MEPVESTREAPCAPVKLRLKQSHSVCVQAGKLVGTNDGETEINQANQMSAGAAIGFDAWQSAPGANIVWAMRWAPAGLMPVRPMVCIKGDGNVPARKALKLLG